MPYFNGIKIGAGQPETEFIRVKGLMSEKIQHPITKSFLKDMKESRVFLKGVSLLRSEPCIELLGYYWNRY
jgi:hypothetical protein